MYKARRSQASTGFSNGCRGPGGSKFLKDAGYPGKLTHQPKGDDTDDKHGARDDKFFIPGEHFGPLGITDEPQVIQEHGSGPAEHRIDKGAGSYNFV